MLKVITATTRQMISFVMLEEQPDIMEIRMNKAVYVPGRCFRLRPYTCLCFYCLSVSLYVCVSCLSASLSVGVRLLSLSVSLSPLSLSLSLSLHLSLSLSLSISLSLPILCYFFPLPPMGSLMRSHGARWTTYTRSS